MKLSLDPTALAYSLILGGSGMLTELAYQVGANQVPIPASYAWLAPMVVIGITSLSMGLRRMVPEATSAQLDAETAAAIAEVLAYVRSIPRGNQPAPATPQDPAA